MIPYAKENEKNSLEGSEPDTSYPEIKNNIKWIDKILLNRPSKIILTIVLVAIVFRIILYRYLFTSHLHLNPTDGYSFGSCLVSRASRLPCGKGNVSEAECHSQCCYDLSINNCYHRTPSRFSYIIDRPWTEGMDLHPRVDTEPFSFQANKARLRLSLYEISPTHLVIHFYDPTVVVPENVTKLEDKLYSYEVSSPEFNLEVKAPQGPIFNTQRGPLIPANNIWEISFLLTKENMYGFGEIPLKESARVLYNNKNGDSVNSLIYAEHNNAYHGLLLDIMTPTEIIINSENTIILRSIATSEIKMHLFIGPNPSDILRDVSIFKGYTNKLKEYWMLGAHVCRNNSETLEESYAKLVDFVAEASEKGMPYSSHCGVAPIVLNNEPFDENTVAYIEKGAELLKNADKHLMPRLSPFIKYLNENSTIENDENPDIGNLFLRNFNSSEIYKGFIDVHPVAYPYYGNGKILDYMKRLWNFNIDYQGLILVNNWPLDESFTWWNETERFLPYFNKNFESAFNNTPQWNITYPDGSFYFYKHNEYARDFYNVIKQFAGNKTLIGSTAQWTDSHTFVNRQNVDTTWTSLRKELVDIALGSVSGNAFWLTPICGDTDNFNQTTQTNLCINWYKASTYFPLIKIDFNNTRKDPLAFSGTDQKYMIQALNNRQKLSPYFFYVMNGGPLLRPMFYEYPYSAIKGITTQFNVGEALLIVPNLLPNQKQANVWMPPGNWFEFWSGLEISGVEGQAVSFSNTEADFLTLIRGGYVVVIQEDVKTSLEETRKSSDYSFVIALNNNSPPTAEGWLYFSEDLKFRISANDNSVTITRFGEEFTWICGGDASSANMVKGMYIYGLDESLNNFDHYKYVLANVNLCDMEAVSELSISF